MCNSLKYAYPSRKRELLIKIHEKDKSIVTIIYDKGIKINEENPNYKKGLGLIVVDVLINQIEGKIEDYPCK